MTEFCCDWLFMIDRLCGCVWHWCCSAWRWPCCTSSAALPYTRPSPSLALGFRPWNGEKKNQEGSFHWESQSCSFFEIDWKTVKDGFRHRIDAVMDYKYHVVITSGLKHKKLLINLLFTARNHLLVSFIESCGHVTLNEPFSLWARSAERKWSLLLRWNPSARCMWKQTSPRLTPTNRDEQTKSNVQCLIQNKVVISSFKKVFSIFKLL